VKVSFIRPLGTIPQTPAVVQGVVATVISSTEIDLTWTAIAGAQNYTVRIFGNPVVTLPVTNANFTQLAPSTQYSFTVAAINSFGEGPQSVPVLATTLAALQPPGQVIGLTATPVSTTEIDLAWSTTALATSYLVQRNSVTVASIPGLTYNDIGLTQATQYQYNIIATNSAGPGPVSASVFASTNAAAGGSAVKWNPGHWTESDTVIGTGGGLANVQTEINMMTGLANVKGYMILLTWGNLQQSINTYTFTNLDAIVAYIKSKGKRWCLQIVAGSFTTTHPNGSTSIIPAYIQGGNTSLYGTAGYRVAGVTTTVAGSSGWWGGDGNGNTYGAALWRPNVMAEYIKLYQAVGTRYDPDPSFEGIYQGEDSFYQGTGSTNGSDYNDSTQLNNWKNFLQACCTAFPTSNVWFSETFLQFQNNSIALTNYITDTGKPYANHPPALAQTDSLGAVQRSATHTWGTQTYAGQLGSFGDRRSLLRFVAEVQAPDQGFFINLGSAREDILAGLNIMKCTHVFWAIMPSSIAATTKPASYPITFSPAANGTSATLGTPWPLTSGTYDLNSSGTIKMTATKGSSAVTFNTTVSASTSNVRLPIVPFNWFNGGTAAAAANGTTNSYTDAGLGAWINDPANALANSAYPGDYP
jgi:hypothetical protein